MSPAAIWYLAATIVVGIVWVAMVVMAFRMLVE
jgi:hypothetical protein